MTAIIVGFVLLVGAVLVITSAEALSSFEKHLTAARPSTRVTGWSGSRKGTQAWRGVGILLAAGGVICVLAGLLPMLLR